MNIEEILKKYEAYRDSYYLTGNVKDPFQENKDWCNAVIEGYKNGGFPQEWEFFKPAYRYLRANWKARIKNNCIGFSLSIAPEIWYAAINDILAYIASQCPYFQIEYIGLKNGGVQFSLSNISEEIRGELNQAEYSLWDYHLLK